MSDVLIIHHSLDANSARLLAKALSRLGFEAPTLCDERGDGCFAPALAAGRAAIAIWSSAASGSAGFTGLAAIADAADKLLSLRGPEGGPPPAFGRAFMLAGWDGSDLKHPGIMELVRTLARRYGAGRGAPNVAPVSAFGAEPPLHPGPASAMRPRPAAQSVRSAAQAALREEGEIAVLAQPRPEPPRLGLQPLLQRQFEGDPARIIRRARTSAPVRRVAAKKKRRASVLSIVSSCAAFGALCGAVGALVIGEMASATHATPHAMHPATLEARAPALASEAPPAAEIVLVQTVSAPAPALEPEVLAAVELFEAPSPFESLAAVDLALDARHEPPVGRLSWRVVARQYVE